MSDMTIQELEHDRKTRYPLTARVDAYVSADESEWIIRCPYCQLLHRHGYDGTFGSAGLRSPHCEDGARGKPGYYLIPVGTLSRRMENEMRRMDRRRRLRLQREAQSALLSRMTGARRPRSL